MPRSSPSATAAIIVLLGLPRHYPDGMRNDNGSQLTTWPVKAFLENMGVKPLFIEPGSPCENG